MEEYRPFDNREELTRQQRNLLLANPIARLALERNVIFKEEPGLADELDPQYLALAAIDHVMECSAIEGGAAPPDVVRYVASEAERMKPALTPEQSRKVGQVVLDYLANARDRHKAFRIEYYDGARGGFSFHDFRLLALHTGDDGITRFKLGTGAQTLTLAMLDISPEFAHEAESIMIRKAIERGRFEDAHAIAKRSRMRSIHYQQFIDDKLFRTRRAADSVTWSDEVIPELDAAREHLQERQSHETTILESIRNNLQHADGEARTGLIQLQETIEDCHVRHAGLRSRVVTASEEFRRLQARAFRARYRQNIPDLEDGLLAPLLEAPIGVVSGFAEEAWRCFCAPSPPGLYDLAQLFETCTTPLSRGDEPDDAADEITEELRPVEPAFSDQEIAEAEWWLVTRLEVQPRLTMADALRAAQNDGFEESMLRCILFLMARSWCPSDDPLGVMAIVDGVLDHRRAAGDNLVLIRDPARWRTRSTG